VSPEAFDAIEEDRMSYRGEGHEDRWTVEIRIADDGPVTTATAIIHAEGRTQMSSGQAPINPSVAGMHRSRKAFAASRVLSALADQLLDAAGDEYRATGDAVDEAVAG
jgi:Domain of unknown function (DUF1876)